MSRRRVLGAGIDALRADAALWSKVGPYVKDTEEVDHFMSIAQSRAHVRDAR